MPSALDHSLLLGCGEWWKGAFYYYFWMRVKMRKSSHFSQGALRIQGMCGACGTEEQFRTSVLLEKVWQHHLPHPQHSGACLTALLQFPYSV